MIPFLDAVQPPTIKLKVKRTTPFLQVKPQAIRLKVKPQFPAQLVGGTGIAVSIEDGIYKVELDVEKLQDASLGSSAYVIIWDPLTRQFARIKISDLASLMGA